MDRTIEYKGYIIKLEFNKKDKNYPYTAIADDGNG